MIDCPCKVSHCVLRNGTLENSARYNIKDGARCFGRSRYCCGRTYVAGGLSGMDFLLNEEQRAVQKVAFDFAQKEIVPYAREYDEQGKINWDALKKMGPLGLLGGPIPEEYGGSGFDYISFGLICEEIERAETAFRVIQS